MTRNTDSSSDTREFEDRVAGTAARDVSGILRDLGIPVAAPSGAAPVRAVVVRKNYNKCK